MLLPSKHEDTPARSDLGLGSVGDWLPVQGQMSCVVHVKAAHPSSMLVSVTLAHGDPWMRPFSRWLCRRMTTAALGRLASAGHELPPYAACVLVDRPKRRKPGDAHETYEVMVYEVEGGTVASMN